MVVERKVAVTDEYREKGGVSETKACGSRKRRVGRPRDLYEEKM
jgi:hypothetical protein